MSAADDAQQQQRRPALSISEAAERTATSRTTIRRALDAGRLPGAWQDERGRWMVPVPELIAAGFGVDRAARGAGDELEGAEPQRQALDDELQRLRVALAEERGRRQAAEQLAEERSRRVEDLRLMLRALPASTDCARPATRSRIRPNYRRWWQRR